MILRLLLNAAALLIMSRLMHPSVRVTSFTTAVLVSIVIGVLNVTVGLLLRFSLNVVTLGLLSFFVKLIVSAVILQLTDRLFVGFAIDSFSTALILASVMALLDHLQERSSIF